MNTSSDPSPVRIALGVGDRALEQRLTRELTGHGIVVARRALDGPGLVEAAADTGLHAVLAMADLHRLDETTLLAVRDRHLPVLLLAQDGRDTERFGSLAQLLPERASTVSIAAAVRSAQAISPGVASHAVPVVPDVLPDSHHRSGEVVAVTSGKGAPGKTTVAIALAAELGRTGLDVVLVDGDLRGGNVAACLDLDPRRGIVGVAASSGPLEQRLEAELQVGPHCAVLSGIERPELAASVTPELLGAVIGTLGERFDRVVVDLGAPPEPVALRQADEVVVVSGADLVSIWNARVALPGIRQSTHARLRLLLNRVEGREHYSGTEVERALDVPTLPAIREDRRAARRALTSQVPLTEVGGRAAHDLRTAASLVRERTGSDSGPRPADAASVSLALER